MEENLNIQPDTAPEAAAVNTETKKKSSKPALFLKKIWNFIKEKRSYFIAFFIPAILLFGAQKREHPAGIPFAYKLMLDAAAF